jgi:rhamnose transport system ATP-binding protein
VFGVDEYDSGSVTFLGKPLPKGSPRAAIKAGMGLVPEDRRKQGLIVDMSIARNLTLVIRRRLTKAGLLAKSSEYRTAQDWAGRLQVKAGSLDSEGGTLSGGNQQKVVLAKWLATGPKLLVVDEPTRGIDVGTKAEVHRLLDELAHQGLGIVMISSELPEVLGMSDRVVVMREGRATALLDRDQATSETVMTAATQAAQAGPVAA